jgi:Cysteine-rich secretory protein family
MKRQQIEIASGEAGLRSVACIALLVAITVIFLSSFISPSFAAGADEPTASERELLESVNRERALEHLSLLKWNAALAVAARAHSDRMAREGNISHRFPGEPELSDRAIQAGVHYSKIAENVAEGPSLSEIHVGWMHSPGHRANILDPNLDSIGIGVSERNGQLYATQDFARAIQSMSFAEQERRFGALLQAEGFRLERDPAEARKACESGHADTSRMRAMYEFHYVTSDLSALPKQLETAIRLGQYHTAAIGACDGGEQTRSGMYRLAILLY